MVGGSNRGVPRSGSLIHVLAIPAERNCNWHRYLADTLASLALVALLVALITALQALPSESEFLKLLRRPYVPKAVTALMLIVAIAIPLIPWIEGLTRAPECRPADGDRAGLANGQLVFGALLPSTGDLETEGQQLYAATRLAVDEISKEPPVNGIAVQPVDTLNFADEKQPDTGGVCEGLARLISTSESSSSVDAIIGPVASSDVLLSYKRLAAAGGLMISPAATSPELTSLPDEQSVFRTVPSDVLQGRVLGDLVVGDGADNEVVAVVARDDPYGAGLQNEVANEISGFGHRTTHLVSYDADPTVSESEFARVTAQLNQLNPKASAIVIIGYDEVAGLVKSMATAGITPGTGAGAYRIYGSDGFLRGTFADKVPGPTKISGIRGTIPFVNQ